MSMCANSNLCAICVSLSISPVIILSLPFKNIFQLCILTDIVDFFFHHFLPASLSLAEENEATNCVDSNYVHVNKTIDSIRDCCYVLII